MVGCHIDRITRSELERACKEVEDTFLLPKLQLKNYINSLVKYAFMGNLSRDQLLAFCQNLEISHDDLEPNKRLAQLFKLFKREDNTYDGFSLKIIGLLYCESTNKEKATDFLLLINPEKEEYLSKDLIETVLLKCMDLATTFTTKYLPEMSEEAKKTAQSMAEATIEQKKSAIKIWCSELIEHDIASKAIGEWIEKGALETAKARDSFLKANNEP